MTFVLMAMALAVAALLGVLLWSSGKRSTPSEAGIESLSEEAFTCRHVSNLQQVRQVFESSDACYLREHTSRQVFKTVRIERRRVAVKYLQGLRADFLQLEEVSSMIAALSPEVDAKQELRRFRLAAGFRLKYVLLRLKFAFGLPTADSLSDLAWQV